jgi:curved DNA-binding protein
MEYKDYYKTLGVAKTANADEIKKAYRQLARKFHPDINKAAGAEAKFKDINEANDVLSDVEKRKAYDELGDAAAQARAQGQGFRPPPGWNEQHHFRDRTRPGHSSVNPDDFSDFFEELFGRRGQAKPQQSDAQFRMRGEDSHARIVVSLRDSFAGATRQMSLRVPEMDASGNVTLRDRILQVKIPKGITEGKVIRLKGQGGPGMGGEVAGDLYLEVQFAPDDLYRAEGRDLYLTLPVAPWEAALGASVKAPTPDGSIMLRIPPNSAEGRELRAKGKGLPGVEPGDLIVKLKIVWPKAESDKARAVYEQMARDMPFNPRSGMGV